MEEITVELFTTAEKLTKMRKYLGDYLATERANKSVGTIIEKRLKAIQEELELLASAYCFSCDITLL